MALEHLGLVSGNRRTDQAAGKGRRRAVRCAFAAALLGLAGIAGGCSNADGAYGDALSLAVEESGASPALDGAADAGAESDLHDLWYQELSYGPAVQHLGVARMLNEVGAIGLLSSYIANIPNGAYFLPNFELQAAKSASRVMHDGDGEARIVRAFEREVLHAVDGAALNRLQLAHEPVRLHDAFFEVFERCGRDSPWPDVKMLERNGNNVGDVLYRDPELGMSDYEYRELLHVCGRYAATYPTLDPAVRDELLAPQRAHFANEVLDRLDNELPAVEIPPRYQAEVDELRQNGW